ncbi:AAA family ATPase [Inquilinus sp. CA228]|uniref:AAA family ATPase n=1 Tax=Inquilinus sp. CA228 TaxID=3455609 RepID=UPI003F8D5AEF
MSRHTVDIKPTRLEFSGAATYERFGDMAMPEDSEPPILAKPVRAVVHQWLQEMQCEAELKAAGLEPRRTALLSGPPGCGKTTLAHHLAARLGLPMLTIAIGALVSRYVGQTGNQIEDLFRALRRDQGSIVLFMDEFDSIGSRRVEANQSAAAEKNSIVTVILQALDRHKGMIFAATNKADNIDPAIWRRFGLHLTIDVPDGDARFAIIARYLSPFTLPDDATDLLTDATAGATPALLRQMMEGIKRDLVLGPRFQRDMSAAAVLERIVTAVAPSEEAGQPPLWHDDRYRGDVAGGLEALTWPPERKA